MLAWPEGAAAEAERGAGAAAAGCPRLAARVREDQQQHCRGGARRHGGGAPPLQHGLEGKVHGSGSSWYKRSQTSQKALKTRWDPAKAGMAEKGTSGEAGERVPDGGKGETVGKSTGLKVRAATAPARSVF